MSFPESAILKYTERYGRNVLQDVITKHESVVLGERSKYPIVSEIPFNSVNKYQVSIHRTPDDDSHFLLVMKVCECFHALSSVMLKSFRMRLQSYSKSTKDSTDFVHPNFVSATAIYVHTFLQTSNESANII